MSSRIEQWLPFPSPPDVVEALQRLRRVHDVVHVAVMPDVHLAHDVCIGVATATTSTLLPEAVGGDIGCGITAARFDLDAEVVRGRSEARQVMRGLQALIPANRHRMRNRPEAPIVHAELSAPTLERKRRRQAAMQAGTVGRGNHFVELQSDDDGRLWVMVHSGSRGMGPAIRDFHLSRASKRGVLLGLNVESPEGQAYLVDHQWAARYAIANRALMVSAVGDVLASVFGGATVDEQFACSHNHVAKQVVLGNTLWVHRKGVISAAKGELGVVAGSMGAPSYHVVGRGVDRALSSCSHGAGRRLSRSEARLHIGEREFVKQMNGIWFDNRRLGKLIGEAPSAYKDIAKVMRAQRELVRIERTVYPLLSFKGS